MLTFSEPFYSWCIFLALQIAKRRGDSTLKPQEMLRRHFEHELFVELPKATFPEDEIPDVLYYGACLVERGCSDVLPLIEDTLQRYGYSLEQAEAMTIAKYLLRGAGLSEQLAHVNKLLFILMLRLIWLRSACRAGSHLFIKRWLKRLPRPIQTNLV